MKERFGPHECYNVKSVFDLWQWTLTDGGKLHSEFLGKGCLRAKDSMWVYYRIEDEWERIHRAKVNGLEKNLGDLFGNTWTTYLTTDDEFVAKTTFACLLEEARAELMGDVYQMDSVIYLLNKKN